MNLRLRIAQAKNPLPAMTDLRNGEHSGNNLMWSGQMSTAGNSWPPTMCCARETRVSWDPFLPGVGSVCIVSGLRDIFMLNVVRSFCKAARRFAEDANTEYSLSLRPRDVDRQWVAGEVPARCLRVYGLGKEKPVAWGIWYTQGAGFSSLTIPRPVGPGSVDQSPGFSTDEVD